MGHPSKGKPVKGRNCARSCMFLKNLRKDAIVLMDEKARKWNESEDLPQSSQIRRLGVKHP